MNRSPIRFNLPLTRMLPLQRLLALALLAFAATGCDSPDDHGHAAVEDHFAEAVADACTHLKNGPAKAHTLTKDAGGAPDLTIEHNRLDLTFVDVGSGQGGVGTWKSGEATDYVLLMSADVAVKITDSTGAEVKPEESLPTPSGCPEAAIAHKVEFAVGTYTLTFGPGTDTGVKAIISEVGGEHGH